ncbi:MAG: ABC transporter permease [Selenomonadales bacterium]|jgi:putative ABC transport system permease protein|nr:ABC transporter permease [Selenomonadales bacterium]
MLKEIVALAIDSVVQNKLRSFLTILGIVIGVGSIIALMLIADGATGSIQAELAGLGGNRLTVNVTGTPIKSGLSEQDLRTLEELPGVTAVSPSTSARGHVTYGDITIENVSVAGRSAGFFAAEQDQLRAGRGIHRLDVKERTHVAVLGGTLARDLFANFSPLGQEIVINSRKFTVVGVLQESGGFSFAALDNSVIVPYNVAERVLGGTRVSSVEVFFAEGTSLESLKASLERSLTFIFDGRDNVYSIFNQQDMLDMMETVTNTLTLLLAGIAAISLLVGGIGIMNMMLVSVTERTSEIGLRKALGAEPGHIMLQFLTEAVIICLLGGAVGILLGGALAYVGARLIGFPFVLSLEPVALAFGFSVAVGLVFGIAPAQKASKLNPIDALRHVG